jgi:hypothetical protein
MVKVNCPNCNGAKVGFAITSSDQGCRTGLQACDFCKGKDEVSSEAAERWREGKALLDACVKQGRSQLQEAKRLGISSFELNEVELGRKSRHDVFDENRSSNGNTAHYYGEIYLGCGERKDGCWDVIVIPLRGEREDVRVVQAELEFLEAGKLLAGCESAYANTLRQNLIKQMDFWHCASDCTKNDQAAAVTRSQLEWSSKQRTLAYDGGAVRVMLNHSRTSSARKRWHERRHLHYLQGESYGFFGVTSMNGIAPPVTFGILPFHF